MTDNVAVLDGYTEEVIISNTCGEGELNCLIKPNTDTGERFKAWDCDEQEYIYINGWIAEVQNINEETTYSNT